MCFAEGCCRREGVVFISTSSNVQSATMTAVQTMGSFVFPEPQGLSSSAPSSLSSSVETPSFLGSIRASGSIHGVPRRDESILSFSTFTDVHPDPRISPQEPIVQDRPSLSQLTIDILIKTDTEYSAAKITASNASARFGQLVVHFNIVNRLYAVLCGFHGAVAQSSSLRHDASKFASTYQQAIELCSYLLKDDCATKPSHFPGMLKWRHRQLLNSFLTLVKSAPSFIVSALLSMSASDLNHFIGSSQDSYEDLALVNRTKPLDILFYCIFPPDTPIRQRDEYFASICGALIEHKRGEPLCFAIFDKIMDQSGHPYASALEIVLLNLLQRGSFLTIPPQSQPIGSSPTSTPTSEFPSPEIANATLATAGRSKLRKPSTASLASSNDDPNDSQTQTFLQQAVDVVFEFLDNPSVESIPQGFSTFVKLVLAKVPEESRQSAKLLICVKYFFCRHLHRVLTLPERLGLLKDYFVSDMQRKKILGLVFRKACQLMMSFCYGSDQGASVVNAAPHEKVRAHIESIFARLTPSLESPLQPHVRHNSVSSSQALPSDSNCCSPGQLIVLSPSDVVSLYSGLFPSFVLHHRSLSANTGTNPLNVEGSSNSSSRPTPRPHSHYGSSSLADGSSVNTGSSFISAPLSNNESLPSLSEIDQIPMFESDDGSSLSTPVFGPADDYEWSLDDIKTDLEPVIQELIKRFPYLQFRDASQYLYSLRPGKLQNFRVPHPLAEKWQIFQVGLDSTINDLRPESILEHTHGFSSSEQFPSHESDDMIHSLPVAPANRGLVIVLKRAVEKIVSEISECPYPSVSLGRSFSNGVGSEQEEYFEPPATATYMQDLLSEAQEKSVAVNKFLDANEYANASNALKKLLPSPNSATYAQVATAVNNHVMLLIAKEKQYKLNCVRNQIDLSQSQSNPYKVQFENARRRSEQLLIQLGDLRTKVWYATEIRSSPLWSRARDVAMALTYGTNPEPVESPASTVPSPVMFPSLKRNNSTSSVHSLGGFSFKRFTSVSSKRDYANKRNSMVNASVINTGDTGMFAPKDLAGEFKLSDREADATKKWLQGQNIQNFCTGEERIHRFCCEVDDLVKRVMGDTLSSRRNRGHSLLSSSSLFRHDLWKLIMDVEGPNRSSTPTTFGNRASMSAIPDIETDGPVINRTNPIRPCLDRSASVRGHSSQRSSPNLLDVFASLDLGRRPPSAHGEYGAEARLHGESSHRRNRSLNEIGSGNGHEPFGDDSAVEDEASVLEADVKRGELDDTILTLQMRLISLIYTDIGTNCFFDGK
jgi:hypothetical protein